MRLKGLPIECGVGRTGAGDDCHLAIFQEHHATRVVEDGGHVGGHVHLILAVSYRYAAGVAEACGNQRTRLVARHCHNGARATEGAQSQAHGFGQGAADLVMQADQVGDGLGVGI